MKDLLLTFAQKMYQALSKRINGKITSFPHRISKILFVLGSLDDFGSLGCRIGEGPFFYVLILSLGSEVHKVSI